MAYNRVNTSLGEGTLQNPVFYIQPQAFSGKVAEDWECIYGAGVGCVTKILKSTGVVVKRVRLGQAVSCLVYYGDSLYCVLQGGGGSAKIAILNPDTLELISVKEYSNVSWTVGNTYMHIIDGNFCITDTSFTSIIRISDLVQLNKLHWLPHVPITANACVVGSLLYSCVGGNIYAVNPLTGVVSNSCSILLNGISINGIGHITGLEYINGKFYASYTIDNDGYNFGIMAINEDLSNVYAASRYKPKTSGTHLSYPYMTNKNISTAIYTDNTYLYIWSTAGLKAYPYTTYNSMLSKIDAVSVTGFSQPIFTEQWLGVSGTNPYFTYYTPSYFGIGGSISGLYNNSSSYQFYTINLFSSFAYDGVSDYPLSVNQLAVNDSSEFDMINDDSFSMGDAYNTSFTVEEWATEDGTDSTVTWADLPFTSLSENIWRFKIETISGFCIVSNGVLEAFMTGTVFADGLVADCNFEWGLTTEYGNETAIQSLIGDGDGLYYSGGVSNFTLPAEDRLIPGRTYHFRAKGVHPTEGVSYGEDATFVAPGVVLPSATISRVGSIKHVYDRTQAGIPPKFYMEVNLGGLAPEYMDAFTDQPITYVINRPPAGGAINGGRPDPVYPPDDSYNDYPPDYDPPWPDTSRPRNGGR